MSAMQKPSNSRIRTHLQPKTNTSPWECNWCSLRYALEGQVGHRLNLRMASTKSPTPFVILDALGDPRLTFLHQLLHMCLSLARIFQLGFRLSDIRSRFFGDFATQNRLQDLHI